MIQNDAKFLIDVIPVARIPLSRQQFFSYVFDRPLPTGTLVLIPLFRRNIEGIVLNSRPEVQHSGGFQLKKIHNVVEETFMTSEQLRLAEKISNHYLTSLGTVLKHFMVKRVLSRNESIEHPAADSAKKANDIILTAEQNKAVTAITENHLKFLLFGPASSGKTEIYLHSILKLKNQDPNRQFLILLPELTLAPQAIQRYAAYFPLDEIVLIHSKISKGQLYQSWQKIKTGKAKIIIGTRMALFAPFQKLGLVVVDEEQDMSFKQWDMNPRYDARLAAEFLSDLFDCPLVFGTSTPRIETFNRTENEKIKLLKLPRLILQDTRYKIPDTRYELVDMRKEKWTDYSGKKKPNDSLLSLKLQGEISYAISHKLQTILFVNHQGMSNFSICSSCKTVLRCPKCDRALVYENSGEHKCLHCNYTSGAFPVCESCKGIEFKNIGIGTQLVEREIKKFFPSATIKRLDGSSAKIAKEKEQVFEDFQNRKIDILIGTQMITKGWDNPNVGLVAIVDSDSLFTSPDFLTDERAFANIVQVAGRTGRIGSTYPGKVLIQTYNPNNIIFDHILKQSYDSFYLDQIKARQALRYPPFGKIIKLYFKNEDKTKTDKTTQAQYDKICKLASAYQHISVMEPTYPLVSKIRNKFIKQILIKIKDTDKQLPFEIIKHLTSLPSDWSIDVDPISVA